MTLDDAKEEAKKRWGPNAVASINFKMSRNCEVYNDSPSRSPAIHGIGETFEEAFEDAESNNPFNRT